MNVRSQSGLVRRQWDGFFLLFAYLNDIDIAPTGFYIMREGIVFSKNKGEIAFNCKCAIHYHQMYYCRLLMEQRQGLG